REGGRLSAERAVFQEDAARRHGLGQLLEGGTTDGIEDDARTLALRDIRDAGGQILLVANDDMRSAEIEQRLFLGARARRRHRYGADHPGDLDRGEPDAAGGGGNDDDIPLSE